MPLTNVENLYEEADGEMYQDDPMWRFTKRSSGGKIIYRTRCSFCKSHNLSIGRTDYTTMIACVDCGWEEVFHEG